MRGAGPETFKPLLQLSLSGTPCDAPGKPSVSVPNNQGNAHGPWYPAASPDAEQRKKIADQAYKLTWGANWKDWMTEFYTPVSAKQIHEEEPHLGAGAVQLPFTGEPLIDGPNARVVNQRSDEVV